MNRVLKVVGSIMLLGFLSFAWWVSSEAVLNEIKRTISEKS